MEGKEEASFGDSEDFDRGERDRGERRGKEILSSCLHKKKATDDKRKGGPLFQPKRGGEKKSSRTLACIGTRRGREKRKKKKGREGNTASLSSWKKGGKKNPRGRKRKGGERKLRIAVDSNKRSPGERGVPEGGSCLSFLFYRSLKRGEKNPKAECSG